MSYQVITEVDNIHTSDTDWWMIYTPNTLETVSPLMQCRGYTSSPDVMVKGDDEAEIEQYIIDNNIKPLYEEDDTLAY